MIKYFLHRYSFREDWSKVPRQEAKPCFLTAGLNEQGLYVFLNYSLQFPPPMWGSCISSLQYTLRALSPPSPHKQHAASVTCPTTHESSAGLMARDGLSEEKLTEESLCKATWSENTNSELTPSALLEVLYLKNYKFLFSSPNNIYSLISIMTK